MCERNRNDKLRLFVWVLLLRILETLVSYLLISMELEFQRHRQWEVDEHVSRNEKNHKLIFPLIFLKLLQRRYCWVTFDTSWHQDTACPACSHVVPTCRTLKQLLIDRGPVYVVTEHKEQEPGFITSPAPFLCQLSILQTPGFFWTQSYDRSYIFFD